MLAGDRARALGVALALLFVWNLFLFQWFGSQLTEVRQQVAELRSSTQSALSAQRRRRHSSAGESSTRFLDVLGDDDGSTASDERNRASDDEAFNVAPPSPALLPSPTAAQSTREPLLPVVIFCYNRADYLRQALTTLFARRSKPHLHPVYVSQDGDDAAVAQVARSFPIAALFQRTDRALPTNMKMPHMAVYYHIALHYGLGLRRTFAAVPDADGVIVLEEDIDIAPDALAYFRATWPLLQRDRSLMAVSAFNDNGAAPRHAPARAALHRSDFFGGLGWLLSRELWHELGPKWPDSFWDDWMRHPDQRRGRITIRPELSRTHTFGAHGASAGQFYKQHLEQNQMNDQDFDWQSEDLAYLLPERYDAQLTQQMRDARQLDDVPVDWSAHANATVLLTYDSMADFVVLANRLQIMNDEKWGVPRTAYHDVVLIRLERNTLVLVAQREVAARARA